MEEISYRDLRDQDLLKKVILKDESAFVELYDRYSAVLYTLTEKIVKDPSTAEYILAEVFKIVWSKAKFYNFATGNVYTWLIYLTRNRAIDSLKRERTESADLLYYDDNYEEEYIIPRTFRCEDNLNPGKKDELKAKTRKALNKLTDAQKYVLHLSFYEGFDLNEISAQLKIPVNTIRSKITTAVLNLRTFLEGQENDDR